MWSAHSLDGRDLPSASISEPAKFSSMYFCRKCKLWFNTMSHPSNEVIITPVALNVFASNHSRYLRRRDKIAASRRSHPQRHESCLPPRTKRSPRRRQTKATSQLAVTGERQGRQPDHHPQRRRLCVGIVIATAKEEHRQVTTSVDRQGSRRRRRDDSASSPCEKGRQKGRVPERRRDDDRRRRPVLTAPFFLMRRQGRNISIKGIVPRSSPDSDTS